MDSWVHYIVGSTMMERVLHEANLMIKLYYVESVARERLVNNAFFINHTDNDANACYALFI
jgi:hypothetical protein